MRELKLRAWETNENRMYEIDLYKYMSRNEDAQSKFMPLTAIHNGVMQYTGLKDKNGKEIYEGDILKTEVGGVGTVVWSSNNCMFIYKYGNGNQEYYPLANFMSIEIIGNMYENPNLLKEIQE